MTKCLPSILSFLFFLQGFSQQFREENFKRFTTKEGLSNNFITGIQQDGNGFIWISTMRGLNRFDGLTFKQFLHSNEPGSIPDNSIFSISGGGNKLLIATDDGVQLLETSTLKSINLEIPTEETLRYWSNACRYAGIDGGGNIAVSTKTGFYIFSADGKLKQRYDQFGTNEIGRTWMMFGSYLHRLTDGNMLQENSEGLLVYDHGSNKIREVAQLYPALTKLSLERKSVRDNFSFISSRKILLLNTGTNSFDIIDIVNGQTISVPSPWNLVKEVGWRTRLVFIGGQSWAFVSKAKGFIVLNVDTTRNTVSFSPQKYMSNYMLTYIFYDSDKRVWLGSEEGLFMQHSLHFLIKSFIVKDKEDNGFSIHSLCFPNNQLIMGTSDGRLLEVDKQTGRIIRSVLLDKTITANPVTSLVTINKDTLWAAAISGLYWLNLNNFSFGKISMGTAPSLLFITKENVVWITTYNVNQVFRYDLKSRKADRISELNSTQFFVNTPTGFAEDRFGNIWMGGDAIARWNPRLRKIDSLITKISSQRTRKRGFTVMSDSNGDIWTSVKDDGFARISSIDPIHLRSENLMYDNTSPTDPILAADHIFTPTADGLAVLNIHDGKAIIFHTDDGLPMQPFTSYKFAFDSTDRSTWFACENIVGKIPFAAYTNYSAAPKLLLSELSVINDSTINFPLQKISLAHNQNDLRIAISAINFNDPANMRFAYRFKNQSDSAWIEMGTQQNILLTNVSPGDYELQVKAYSQDNKWPEQLAGMSIEINPPFWKTGGFILIVTLALVGGVYYFYRSRIRKIQQKANIDKLLAQTEMKALHAQMNPHFIFNCLNSIREMILNNENQQASHYLSKFAYLIRITLNNSSKPFISLQNTIDYLKRYLEMEQIRKENFSYQIEVDESIPPGDTFLSPMLIQPFIENAIWHGSSESNKKIDINIHFKQRDDHLICIVEDNGIGIQTSLENKYDQKEIQDDHHSLGITNVKQRIQVLNEKYNLNSRVTVEDKRNLPGCDESGTLVTLHLPMKIADL